MVNWEYLHPLDENDRFSLVGDDGACPYFWPIGSGPDRRHMLLYFSHMSGGKYLIGDYDTERDKLVVTAGGRFNFGTAQPGGVHAPSATPDSDGGLIVIFNMNPAKPTRGWDQVMSLPRRLTLGEHDEVEMEPAGDIASLRGRHVRVGPAKLPANRDVVLEEVSGTSLEIAAVIDPQDAPTVEIDVLRSPRREEYTRISFYRRRGFRNRERYAGRDRDRSLAASGQPDHPGQRALVRTAGRAVAGAGDGTGLRRSGRAAGASHLHRPQRGGGVRQRPPVRGAARLSRTRGLGRRVAARLRQRGDAPLPRRLADGEHLRVTGVP